MHPAQCHHCGYELTGLTRRGSCPECGEAYDTQSTYRAGRTEHPLARHGVSIALGLIALCVLLCGGLLSAVASKNAMGLVIVTLVIAAVPAFGAFTYWWSDRQERRGSE